MTKRWIPIAVLTAALSGCAPLTAPPGLEPARPALTDTAFATRDGLRLPLKVWRAENERAVVVALHGMGDYAQAFAMPAPWWAERGITTYAYDQRGFGEAPFLGVWPGADALREDLKDCVAAVRAAHPGVPVYALGASMGGAVVLSSLAGPDPPAIDGAILVAPAVWGRADMPWAYVAALWLAVHTDPGWQLTGRGLPIWPSDNLPMLRKNAYDLRIQKRTRADAVWGLVNLMDEARAAPEKLVRPPPILFLYGAKDQVVPAAPTEAAIKALGPRAEVHKFPYGYHMLLRDLSAVEVWRTVADWIGRKGATEPLPPTP